jgi:hypothetical protein
VELRGRKCHVSRSKSVFKRMGEREKKGIRPQLVQALPTPIQTTPIISPNRIPNACYMSALSESQIIPKWRRRGALDLNQGTKNQSCYKKMEEQSNLVRAQEPEMPAPRTPPEGEEEDGVDLRGQARRSRRI